MGIYKAYISAMTGTPGALHDYSPAHWAHETIQIPFQLPEGYTAPAAVFSAQELNQPQ